MEIIKCEACNREFVNQEALDMHNSAKHGINLNNAKEKPKTSRKTLILIIGIVLLAILISYFFMKTGNAAPSNQYDTNGVQKITLGFKNNYYPNTITVEAGKPVEITLDSSVRGCFRSFNIKGLGINHYSSGSSDTIKFTPEKKGSFEFACGMRMGYGTIIVK